MEQVCDSKAFRAGEGSWWRSLALPAGGKPKYVGAFFVATNALIAVVAWSLTGMVQKDKDQGNAERGHRDPP